MKMLVRLELHRVAESNLESVKRMPSRGTHRYGGIGHHINIAIIYPQEHDLGFRKSELPPYGGRSLPGKTLTAAYGARTELSALGRIVVRQQATGDIGHRAQAIHSTQIPVIPHPDRPARRRLPDIHEA
jgi:hypothetical protein